MSTDPARAIFEELATWTPEDFERHNERCQRVTEFLETTPLGQEIRKVQRHFNLHVPGLPVEDPRP